VIDWDRVNELRSEVGDDDFADVVTIFLEETGDILASMSGGQTIDSYRANLHLLKGSALNLGFAELAGLCHPVPGAHSDNDGSRARHVERLHDVFQRSRDAFLAPAGG
jgi:hypothetical protein